MSDAPKTFYLIDGHAQIFRAYFAIRGGMTSPVTGEPTQAVFGFAGMLLKLFKQYKPDYVAMAIDMPGKTFRDELYPEYKATREPLPDDFRPQEERIFEMCRYFGIPILGVKGAEADDVIATISRRLQSKTDEPLLIRIVSKDKDLEQLIDEQTVLFDIHTDMTNDLAKLKEDKGITPEQVIDVLALMGDKVDNIPGVDGVGPKTAVKLIAEHGSVEGVLDNIDKIKGKRKENIQKAADHLPLSKQLVTLKDDVEFDFALEDAAPGPIDAVSLRKLFKDLGFNRHSNDLDELVKDSEVPVAKEVDDEGFAASLFDTGGDDDDAGAVSTATPSDVTTAQGCDYQAVVTEDALKQLVKTLKDAAMLAVDTETIGTGQRAPLCGICLSHEPKKGWYIPVLAPEGEDHLPVDRVLDALRPILSNPAIPKCGHNLKYDWHILKHAGIELQGIAFDSMIAGFLVNAPSRALDHMARGMLKHETIPITALIGPRDSKQKTMDQISIERITPYAAEDADISLRLQQHLMPELEAMGMKELADDVEMPLVEVLATMERNGIRVDPNVLLGQKEKLAGRIDELRKDIFDAAGETFNLDSPKQLGEILFTKLELPVIKRTQTGPSTDVEVLEKLIAREDLSAEKLMVPELIVEYRQLSKLTNTYLDNLREAIHDETGRIHASFHQTGAATGRLSSSGPNLQNIPIRTDLGREIRKAFIAEEGHELIGADYSQIELRMLAHLSKDKALTQAFESGMDIHTAVASQVFDIEPDDVDIAMRTKAKTINFGIIYGVTPWGLARRIEGLDVSDAKKLIDDYKARFPGIDAFLQHCIQQATDQGHVTTILGRRRRIAQIGSSNPNQRALGERLAINTAVQGSAADLIKLAMVKLHRRIRDEALPLKMLLQIHDELVLEAPAGEVEGMSSIVQSEMENAMTLSVPLVVDLAHGASWFETK